MLYKIQKKTALFQDKRVRLLGEIKTGTMLKKTSVNLANFPGKKTDLQEEVNVAVTADDPMKVAKRKSYGSLKILTLI